MGSPEPQDSAETGNDDLPPVPAHGPLPELPADNTVTAIMPIIAPWPAAGEPLPTGAEPAVHASVRSDPVPVSDPPAVQPPPVPPDWPDTIGDGPREPLRAEDAKTEILGRLPASAVSANRAETTGSSSSGAAASSGSAGSEVRSGPVAIEADAWDEPVPVTPPPRPNRIPTRVRIVVGLVLLGLGAAVGIPFAFSAGETEAPEAAGLPTALDQPPGQISAASAEPSPPADVASAVNMTPQPRQTAVVEVMPPVDPPTGTSSAPGQTTSPPGAPTPGPSPPAQPTPPAPPPFPPVTFEGEAGMRTGSAGIWDGYPNASGGRVVRNIGAWGGTPGTLRINNVNIPSTGPYTLTIYFVHIDNERNRSATITVSGNPAFTVGFVGGTTCCQVKVITNITMTAGLHTITFANPTGHAPSIDKVVVSRT